MEINGTANMRMFLEQALEFGDIEPVVYDKLIRQVDLTERYMLAHDRDNTVTWGMVVAHPEDFYTLAEFMERGF